MHDARGPPAGRTQARRGPDAGETQLRALTDAGETRFARVLDAVFDKLFLGSTVYQMIIRCLGFARRKTILTVAWL